MKYIITAALSFWLHQTALTQTPRAFTLKGTVTGQQDGLMYLNYLSQGARVRDSAIIIEGRFSFNGKVVEPTIAHLSLKEEQRSELNNLSFFLEPSTMTVKLSFNKFQEATFTGSSVQKEFEALNTERYRIRKKMQPLLAEYEQANKKYLAAVKNKLPEDSVDLLKEQAAEVRNKFTPYNLELDETDYRFFRKHPASYVTAYMLRFHVSEIPLDTLQMYYDALGATVQQSVLAGEIEKQILQLRGGSPGSPAKNFTAKDINGTLLSLTDFKGQYVLLDFWASWCVPCRKGNPHLKELYKKYKDKGIEFIGVSDDDRNPTAWKNAVAKDGLPWRQVLRGLNVEKTMNGEKNETEINEKYGIHTLPTKILIDKQGMIIGRFDENEEALDLMLEKIFGA